jgi:hypothetical protein
MGVDKLTTGAKVLKHIFVFNEKDNGGQQLMLITKFISNGDPITENTGIYVNQELTLNSYGNSSSFNFYEFYLTPENLRKLANQLEVEINKIVATKVLSKHIFVFNEKDNGGKRLMLITKFISNGDPITENTGIFVNQELTLNSYSNSSSFDFYEFYLTPENLRKLANQLEVEINKIVANEGENND